jgi:enoyl-CoA hydratase/carnithine racemase
MFLTRPVRRPGLPSATGKVLIVTINRPESRNVVNPAVTLALGDALEDRLRAHSP